MPRKIETETLKNRRDICLRKIEKNDLSMKDTRQRLQETLDELERREKKRTDGLKDKLFEVAMPYFGMNISEKELEDWFKKIMNDDRNKGAVTTLKRLEEDRIRKIEADDAIRFEKLKEDHKTLFADSKKAAKADDDLSATDSDSNADEDSPVSESNTDSDEKSDYETDEEESSEDEDDSDSYMNSPEFCDRMPEGTISEESKT